MNNHSLSWRDNLRFSRAFSARRREDLRIGLSVAAILIGFGIVGSLDYADELRQEAAAAEQRSDMNRASLLACLNGGHTGLSVDHGNGIRQHIVCGAPYTVSDENTGGRR